MKRTEDRKLTEACGRPDASGVRFRWPLSRMPFKVGCVLFLGVVLMAAQQSGQTPAQNETHNSDAANAQHKKQIADDAATLLKLATDLKAEVDKTDKDTLSVNVIRKADEIEKLARAVREKTKLTVTAN